MTERNILTRERLLEVDDLGQHEFSSPIWGGTIVYRHPRQADKAEARRLSTRLNDKGTGMELDGERVETALIVLCTLEPKLRAEDVELLMNKNGNEIKRLARAILGEAANPLK